MNISQIIAELEKYREAMAPEPSQAHENLQCQVNEIFIRIDATEKQMGHNTGRLDTQRELIGDVMERIQALEKKQPEAQTGSPVAPTPSYKDERVFAVLDKVPDDVHKAAILVGRYFDQNYPSGWDYMGIQKRTH